MRTPGQLSIEEKREIELAYLRGESPADLDRLYGLRPRSVGKLAYRRGWKRSNTIKDVKKDPTERLYEYDTKIEALQGKVRYLNRQYKQALKEKNLNDRLIEAARDAIISSDPIEPMSIDYDDDYNDPVEHRAVALMSDVHVGEVVSADETNNLSEYNMELFHDRLDIWTNEIINTVVHRRDVLNIPNLDIFMLGDMISGDIHDELSNSNDVSVVDQMVEASRAIASSVLTLSQYFDNVRVTGVAGNHGRMRRKPYYKGKQRQNWDYLCYQLMAMHLSHQNNIEFNIPEAFWTLVDVLGTKFVLMHGDGMQSWSGLPWTGITKTVLKFRELLGADIHFDRMVMGHYHDPVETENWIINGNFKGGDEFSIGKLYVNNRPSQTLLYVREDEGVIESKKIYLDGGARKVSIPEGRWDWDDEL